MRCPRFALILYRNRRTNPVWGHLIRPFGALTGACRPGLAENSTLDCFPGAAALLKGKAFGGRAAHRRPYNRAGADLPPQRRTKKDARNGVPKVSVGHGSLTTGHSL